MSGFSFLDDRMNQELTRLEKAGLRRSLTWLESVEGPCVTIHGKTFVSWCSNDYLGLSLHPRLAEATALTARLWGVGARASRLLGGSTDIHRDLERELADWFGCEDALVFSSGYLANLGALGTLLDKEDVVYVDRLAHASLVDAARSTKARFRIFPHNNVDRLDALLKDQPGRRRLIVTEGLFSMDGDRAPIENLIAIAECHDAMVYVDDAHGAFVNGESGVGSCEGINGKGRLLQVVTLGKALGTQGGCVLGPRSWIDWLKNRARTFIYSTGLAIPVAAAAREALRVIREEPQHRQRLWENIRKLGAESPIHPYVVGETQAALDLAKRLYYEEGIWVPAIRPPTVPKATARLRIGITALHTDAQIHQLRFALKKVTPMSDEQ